ncbi:helix-turn-helix domain-containing protein [Halomonas campaniensis]|uniref:Helix-turn-helix domain-containing protein n=1 Tax=Halomonas campaniensis TaxID=213554 RepID=A0A246S470_9GAMM|nr:helix-turn-helix domain-containing protein [Halomonas campaniensis]OWV31257.1 hypothetical protein JI62_01155 [Halomonas campaniensis]
MKALVTYREAAEMLSVSHWTVRQMVRDGRLNVAGEGKGRRVTMGSILRLGELDSRAFEETSHTASTAPDTHNRGKAARHHVQGNSRSENHASAASQASNSLDELLKTLTTAPKK